MAYSEILADRIRKFLAPLKTVEEKKMMGGLTFMVNQKMCLGINKDKKTGEDRLMARIGKDAYAAALQKKGCREMDFTGKVMEGFVFIYSEGFEKDGDLNDWIQKALDYNKVIMNKK